MQFTIEKSVEICGNVQILNEVEEDEFLTPLLVLWYVSNSISVQQVTGIYFAKVSHTVV